MKYGNRSPWKRVISSPFSVIFVLIIFIFMAKAGWSVYQKSRASSERLSQSQTALASLQARSRDLSDKVSYLSTKEGIESEIRTKFRARGEGESVAVIIDDNPRASSTEEGTTTRVSWWHKLLHAVGL